MLSSKIFQSFGFGSQPILGISEKTHCAKFLTRISSLIFLFVCSPTHAVSPSRTQQLSQIEAKVEAEEFKKITSVLVQQRGKLVYEKYFNNGNQEYLNNIRSASKSFTALLLGNTIDDGLLKSEMEPVLKYIAANRNPYNPFPNKQKITFQDLLTMSSSLECNDWEQHSAGNEEKMYLRKDWVQFTLDLPERGIPPWQPKAEERKYARAFSYCTAGVFLTGAVIEKLTEKSLGEYANQKLFNNLGITNVKWPISPSGIYQGGGGLEIRSRDLVKLGQLVLDKGKSKGQQLIPARWINNMLKPRVVAMPDRNIEYGYLWWIFEFETPQGVVQAYAAVGNGGNYLFVVPKLDLVSVITSEAYNTPYMHQQSQSIMKDFILKAFTN